MQKLKMHSADLTAQHLTQLQALFPHCFCEGKIDFELLQQELSEHLIDGSQERYQLNWVGKREAILAANAPIAKTLRPVRAESVNFDTTENLFIEGDNLEALKLLQETYLGKVKMIYIDPPYNTGNDFVYRDNFAENTADFLARSNQTDEDGNRLVANPESNGRFHSDWLSMIYPRLKLARNLLADDGVIFISIDDNEQANLKRVCDEIFGEQNFEGNIHWRRRHNQPNDKTKMIGLVAEHILCYTKDSAFYKKSGVGKLPLTGDFSNPDNDPRGEWASKPWKVGSDQSGSFYSIISPTGIEFNEEWMGDEKNFNELLADGRIYFTKNGNGLPRKKYYKFEREQEGQCATNWWDHSIFGHNQLGNEEVATLFGFKNIFSNPKNTILLKALLNISNCKHSDIVLDFFAGSATTAHAVMQLNAEDGGNRKFIMVQLPEKTDEKSEAYKAGFSTIAEISKERIRRAGKQIQQQKSSVDVGFRVLKIDSSNLTDLYYTPNRLNQADLFSLENPIKADRSAEDLLFQALLDLGIPLSSPIECLAINGKSVFKVADKRLVACFEEIDEALMTELAKMHPQQAVFLDAKFANDSVKINAVQIFKQLSPSSVLNVI